MHRSSSFRPVRRISTWGLALFAVASLLGSAPSAAAAGIAPISAEHSVSADADASSLLALDFASDGNLSLALTAYTGNASAGADLPGIDAWGSALQLSPAPDALGASATGFASAAGVVSDPDGLADAISESFFELVFEATEPLAYTLRGMVSALVSGDGGDASAFIELVDLAAPLVPLFSSAVGAGGVDVFSVQGALVAGAQYRLTAQALGSALVTTLSVPAGTGAGSGVFDFALQLQAVPEPSTGALLALGIGGLFVAGRPRGALA